MCNSAIVVGHKTIYRKRSYHIAVDIAATCLMDIIHHKFVVATFKEHLKTHLFDLAFPP